MLSPASSTKASAFAALHRPGDPLILFNAWDPGSAKVVAAAGAKAVATGSWAVADAMGYEDGEKLPLALALDNLRRILAVIDLPLTMDLEGGYGDAAATLVAAAQAGAVGCNIEDRVISGEGLIPLKEQARRLALARDAVGSDFFINARTDPFLASRPEEHAELIDEALERAMAYADSGASGLFVPGLVDEALIARICRKSPLPVNLLVWPGLPKVSRLAELGVARISHGSGPYSAAMRALGEAARLAHIA